MYAIIQDGGHQYHVQPGQRLDVELRPGSERGDAIAFDQVCFVGGEGEPRVGRPYVEGAKVEAKGINPEKKGTKIDVFFYRRRKSSRRHVGHRQRYTVIEVTGITG